MIIELQRDTMRRAFDRASARYDSAAQLQAESRRELLERLEILRLEPAAVLDLGAGPGAGTKALAKRYPRAQVLALDLSLGMLQEARRQSGLLRKFHRVAADARVLPLRSASVDLVFSNLLLQWCNPPDEVFAEVRRVLRPGGFFAFSSFGPQTLQELRAAWTAVDARPHVHEFIDMHDLGGALARAGFAEPVLDVDRMRRRYPDPRALMRELQTIGARNAARDRPRGLTGRSGFARMLEAYEKTGSGVEATFEVIYGAAWAGQERASGEFAVAADSIRPRAR